MICMVLPVYAGQSTFTVFIDTKPYLLTTHIAAIPAAPVSNTLDHGDYWRFMAYLTDGDGNQYSRVYTRNYKSLGCVPTDPEQIVDLILTNTVSGLQGYVDGGCPVKIPPKTTRDK